MIGRLLARSALKRLVIVADPGLLSIDNIESLGHEQRVRVDYILAMPGRRYAEFTGLLAEHHLLCFLQEGMARSRPHS